MAATSVTRRNSENEFVFADPLGRRRRRLTLAVAAAAGALLVLLSVSVAFVTLPAPGLAPATRAGGLSPAVVRSGLAVGFYDPATGSLAALQAEWSHLTHVAPVWMRLDAAGGLQVNADRSLVGAAHQHNVRVWPVLQDFSGGSLNVSGLSVLDSESARSKLAEKVTAAVVSAGADGVNVDLEGMRPDQLAGFEAFISRLSSAMHRAGKEVAIDVPVVDTSFPLGRLSSLADWILLMAYDQHTDATAPGPVASARWSAEAIDSRLAEISPSKVILGLGGYGYDWSASGNTSITYREALQRAPSAAAIQWDGAASAPWFTYASTSGEQHTVWFSDATSLAAQAVAAKSARLAGISLWRIGGEDPAAWRAIGRDRVAAAAPDLGVVTVDPRLATHDSAAAGLRHVVWDASGDTPVGERYLQMPSSFPEPTGLPAGTVALTFDDGPDPVWTPRILAILARYGAHATFFVVGARAAAHPEVVDHAYDAGNEIGNHSFSHASNLEGGPAWRFTAEMTATQRIIEGATGHGTTLLRYPYTSQQAFPDATLPEVKRAAQLGYTEVGAGTSTDDWNRPGVAAIVTMALNKPDGSVILLHDGGGDRSETVAALPIILSALQSRGLSVVPIAEAMGTSRAAAMPEVQDSAFGFAHAADTATGLLSDVIPAAWWIFVAITVVGFCRILLLGGLGMLHWALPGRSKYPAYTGLVTVLIPAHNEEKVIRRTLDSIENSDYRALEIIVIDDGSTDGTAAAVAGYIDSSVRYMWQPQSGKAAALENGFRAASSEIVVCLDADTLFTPATISALVAPFGDPRVGATCGNPKVGNRVNMLTRLQAIEYLLSINLDRRGYALLNCIPVVPGAVGAWRRSAIATVGGFPANTLTEDMDATVSVTRAGYRVVYTPRAVAYTEAPQTLKGLHGQRKRWSYGTLQVLWKHRRALLARKGGSLGFVALPSVWFCTVVFPFLWPVMYTVILVRALAAWSPDGLWMLLLYNSMLIVFLGWALLVDGESILNLLLLPVYVAYRQVIQVIELMAVVRALRGERVGWNPVSRVGSVKMDGFAPVSTSHPAAVRVAETPSQY